MLPRPSQLSQGQRQRFNKTAVRAMWPERKSVMATLLLFHYNCQYQNNFNVIIGKLVFFTSWIYKKK